MKLENSYRFSGYLLILFSQCILAQRKTTAQLLEENIPEDGRLNFTQLAEKYGHTSEEREVTTADGYIITLFRLNGAASGEQKTPVLLLPGLFGCSDNFLLRGNDSLGITMANMGYDVWFGNYRGNKHGRKHVRKNPNTSKSFWDFSFHEMGIYDVPAMIDSILETSGTPKLQVIGHSQGNLVIYVLGTVKREYNDKISLLIALNPVCHLRNLRGKARSEAFLWPVTSTSLAVTIINDELFRTNSAASNRTKVTCTKSDGYEKCGNKYLFPVMGETNEIGKEFFPILIGGFPDGTSRKNVNHIVQLTSRGPFSFYDYGYVGNVLNYGMNDPPDYGLNKLDVSVAMFVGKNDNIATETDAEIFRDEIPNLVRYTVLELNHLDMVFGKTMKETLYPSLFELLDEYQFN